jgi:signal transduction histidine kinase
VQGAITIAAQPQAHNGVAVTICDTGVGIAHECLPYIFDRFYRIDPSRSSSGLGLGLAIAQEIARHHGGSITGKSEVGQGTTFTVQLSTM